MFCIIPTCFWFGTVNVWTEVILKKEIGPPFIPCEIVSDHSSSDGHLLEGENELADPDETDSVKPDQELQRLLYLIFNQTCGVAFYWCPCKETHEWIKTCGRSVNIYYCIMSLDKNGRCWPSRLQRRSSCVITLSPLREALQWWLIWLTSQKYLQPSCLEEVCKAP